MKPNTWADPERWFWPRVEIGESDECWPWTGTVHHKGYGVVRVSGKQWRANRVAFVLTYGEPDEDVLHRCGNRLCCNPAHLYDGDDFQNWEDRREHGRGVEGVANPRAKLTPETVAQIRASAEQHVVLARQFGVSSMQIIRIRRGESWRTA